MVPHIAAERRVWWRRRLAGTTNSRSRAKKRPKQSSCYIRRGKFRLALLSFAEQGRPYADLGCALFDGDLEIMRHPR